jgi:hypothetical protein
MRGGDIVMPLPSLPSFQYQNVVTVLLVVVERALVYAGKSDAAREEAVEGKANEWEERQAEDA